MNQMLTLNNQKSNYSMSKRIEFIKRLRLTLADSTNKDKLLDYKKFISYIALENGRTYRNVREIIDLLISTGEVVKTESGNLIYMGIIGEENG